MAYNEGIAKRILTNSSTIHQVAWLDDNTAVIAPRDLPKIGYQARAIGIRTACHSITPECVDCDRYDTNVALTCDGPEVGPTINCRGPTPFNATAIGSTWSFINRNNGTVKFGASSEKYVYSAGYTPYIDGELKCSPLALGSIVRSGAYYTEQNLGSAYFVGDT